MLAPGEGGAGESALGAEVWLGKVTLTGVYDYVHSAPVAVLTQPGAK